jgi:DNA topoisomerase-1
MKNSLVIVESPAKARTLEKILGKGYKLMASKGHIRDLPKSRIGVDIEHDFAPKYVVSRDKSQAVNELKTAAKKASCIYLATDPDREGEAIAWHLSEVINGDKPVMHRVVFHEITPSAIEQAFKHPRNIDNQLVNAQQARRILDRLVGYKLSPLLWAKIRRGLSAGRVQSVAVKIIVDREREIENFKPVEFWTISAELLKAQTDAPVFKAVLVGLTDGTKLEIPDFKTAEAIKSELKNSRYTVLKITTKRTKRPPAPPFITSTLQQEAWRHFRFSAKRTMALAQQLYEGLALGSAGETGLITYMRTDSTHVAQPALAETREFISHKYGSEYLPAHARNFTGKVKGAQEAHEAIRPTSISREPALIKAFLTPDQFKLYQIIWKRMVASQMEDAVFDNTTIDIEALYKEAKTRYLLRTLNSNNIFPGFMMLYAEQKDKDEEDEDKKTAILPDLKKGDALNLVNIKSEQNFTKPPPRFTEATLIKMLEQYGIGRPSTYAPIISTIQEREYVVKETGTFKPTELGILVNDMLVENFKNIVSIDYTAQVETKLDQIASQNADWVAIVREFYNPLKIDLDKASANVERIKLEDEPAGENCPNCGKPMLIKMGRFGKFIACSDYPTCKTTKPFQIKTGVPCPDCPEKGELVGRFNKKGKIFYGCNAYPKHKFAINARPLPKPCPECGGLLTEYGKSERCTKCNYKGKKSE